VNRWIWRRPQGPAHRASNRRTFTGPSCTASCSRRSADCRLSYQMHCTRHIRYIPATDTGELLSVSQGGAHGRAEVSHVSAGRGRRRREYFSHLTQIETASLDSTG